MKQKQKRCKSCKKKVVESKMFQRDCYKCKGICPNCQSVFETGSITCPNKKCKVISNAKSRKRRFDLIESKIKDNRFFGYGKTIYNHFRNSGKLFHIKFQFVKAISVFSEETTSMQAPNILKQIDACILQYLMKI